MLCALCNDAAEHVLKQAGRVGEAFIGAPLDDFAPVHDQDLVAVAQGAGPVGDGDDRGAVGAAHGLDLLLDIELRGVVQG